MSFRTGTNRVKTTRTPMSFTSLAAVQERYKFPGFLCVSIASLHGVALRPPPFHGGNTGSNPVGDAKPITYRRNVYSLLNKRIGNRCSRETSPRKPTQWIRHTPGTQAGHLHTEPLVLIGSWSSGSWYRSRLIGSEPPVILLAAIWTQRVRPQLTLSI